jgi:O-antigen ligase
LTYSRAVWLGLAAGLTAQGATLAFRQLKQRVRLPLWKYALPASIALLLLVGVLVRFTPAGIFLRSAFDPTYGSNEERLEFLVRLIAPLSNREALLGKGLGDVLEQNFREAEVTTFDIAAGDARAVQLTKNRTLVDNQYLKTLVEMGLTGLLIYAWLYWRFAAAAFQLAVKGKTTEQYVLGLTGIGFIAAFALQAFFIDIWDIFPTNALFWILAAHISAASGKIK